MSEHNSTLSAVLDDIVAAAENMKLPVPHRPWLEPLPEVIVPSDFPILSHPGTIGLLDCPQQQEQRALQYLPAEDGNLVIIGSAASGKSFALQTVSEAVRSLGYRSVFLDWRKPESLLGIFEGLLSAPQDLGPVPVSADASGGEVSPAQEPTLILLDSFEDFRERYEYGRESAGIYQQFVELISSSRRYNCTVVVTASREHSLPSQLVPYCRTQLFLGAEHPEQRPAVVNHSVLASFFAESKPAIAGRGWVQQGGLREFQLLMPKQRTSEW
ncbi:MAG: hypothetical protein WBA28_01665 [Microbacteriaceae bacterium]